MAVPKDPLAAAAKVRTELGAARLNDDLETELAMNPELDPLWESRAEQARDELASRFGGFDRLHEVNTTNRRTAGVHGDRRRRKPATSSKPANSPTSPSSTSKPSTPSKPSRAARAKSSAPARLGAGAAKGAGSAIAATGVTSTAGGFGLWIAGATVLVVLLYVFITGNGPRALQISGGSFVNALRMFIAPTDPLAKRASSPAPSSSPSSGATRSVTHTPITRPPLAPGPNGQQRPT